MQANSDFSVTEIRPKINSEFTRHTHIDEIVAIADEIWKKVCDARISKYDQTGNEKLHEALKTEYPDFASTFPVVLCWQAMLRKYHPSAFRGYLAKYAKNLQKIYGSQKEFLTFQAEYPAFVHLALNPGTSKKEIEQIRREYIDSYCKEEAELQSLWKQAETATEAEQKFLDSEDREELFKFLSKNKIFV
ncbi:unnamed protein product [Rhizophagus irregularis]|uniref:Uncharacterized protein n=1 Tax=Rhizophagus irregularis TaxID=588596 RepID=A0A916EF61_9GLOM|nr:unnamed protein product [Rhizophagus irregularis]